MEICIIANNCTNNKILDQLPIICLFFLYLYDFIITQEYIAFYMVIYYEYFPIKVVNVKLDKKECRQKARQKISQRNL